MHKKSRLILIFFFIILIFGASSIYSNNVIEDMKSKQIGYLNDVIFIPEIPGIHKDYEFLMKVNQNELKLFNNDLVLFYTKNFEKNINSVQLLEKNKTNIFLVAVNNKIYYLDKCLNIKEEFSPDFEIKKVLSVWNNEEKTYNFIVQSDRSIYCYSSIMAKLWRYPINKNFDEEILSLSLTNNQFNIPIIFGNTKNEVFLVGLNGGKIVKKNFSEVFSVHPLPEGIVVYCYEYDAPDEKKYVLKMIRFDDPKKENLDILHASKKPFNAITTGSIQSDKPHMIFFQEGSKFVVVKQNGEEYTENPINLNSQIEKIIIEDLDNVEFQYKFPYEPSDPMKHRENVNEIVLVCKNEIIFCVPKLFGENWKNRKMNIIEIGRHQINNLDNFFIPDREDFPKEAIYNVEDVVRTIRLMYDSWSFGKKLEKFSNFMRKENYRLANQKLEEIEEDSELTEYYFYEDYVEDEKTEIAKKAEEYREIAEKDFSEAENEFEKGNYKSALELYFSALKGYKQIEVGTKLIGGYEKSGPNAKVTEVYKQCFYHIEEMYRIKKIENYKIKIEVCSFLYNIFNSRIKDTEDYPWWEKISELANDNSLDEDFRKDVSNFDNNHFEAFRTSLQEIMDSADADEKEGKLELALDKYYAVRAPYDKYKLDKEKLAFIDNKIITLNSKIEKRSERNTLFFFAIILVSLFPLYRFVDKKIWPWLKEKREKPEERHYKNLKGRLEEAKEDLLKNEYIIPAGCLAGVILETILDIYIEKNFKSTEIQNFIKNCRNCPSYNNFTLENYIHFLQKNTDISKIKIKKLNLCQGTRNGVVHSLRKGEKYVTPDDIEELINSTIFFLDFFLKEKTVSKKKV